MKTKGIQETLGLKGTPSNRKPFSDVKSSVVCFGEGKSKDTVFREN